MCMLRNTVLCYVDQHNAKLEFVRGTQGQVQHMTKKYHIYMTLDGRISMAGLSGSSCKYLAEAMKDAVENVKA